MPVRGKILNCLKADYPRIFKSEIITDLLKVLGCGVEVPGKFVKDLNAFDINNLRWNKVILCTDADVDGFQIRTLILTMIYRLCPTLIREGYVYIAETPLFEITCGEKTWFAYTDKEKNDIVKTLEGKRYKVDRSKGLGENDPEMMWLTTMNPETRRLIKVMPEDAEATAHSFDLLLGDNLQGRKDHIAEKRLQIPRNDRRIVIRTSRKGAFTLWKAFYFTFSIAAKRLMTLHRRWSEAACAPPSSRKRAACSTTTTGLLPRKTACCSWSTGATAPRSTSTPRASRWQSSRRSRQTTTSQRPLSALNEKGRIWGKKNWESAKEF